MLKTIHLLLLGIIGAAIVHIVVLLLIPVYSGTDTWARIEAMGDSYSFLPIDEKSGLISNSDPLTKAAICHFDLANGPVQIKAKGNVPIWSLSIYAPNGDNLYSVNDNISTNQELDLIISNPLSTALLKAQDSLHESNAIIVEQNLEQGAIILRSIVPDATWRGQVERFFKEATCTPFETAAKLVDKPISFT